MIRSDKIWLARWLGPATPNAKCMLAFALCRDSGTIQMTESYDFYKAAERMGRQLVEGGQGEWKARMDDAIAAGSTGPEILMTLRWTFFELQESATASDAVKLQISEFNRRLADLGI